MKLRVAKKVMRRYYRTGVRARGSTFVRAFNITKIPGCRYTKSFNVAKSIAKLEAIRGPPPSFEWFIPMRKILDDFYRHMMERQKP